MLRIHLVLIRIRILDPHLKKKDPDPGYFFKIYWIFITKNNFQIGFFSLIFILNPFRNEETFIIFRFLKVQIWVLEVKKGFLCSFWLIFYPLDPWIRIFLRIRIQETKILRIQRIRILSTVCKVSYIKLEL